MHRDRTRSWSGLRSGPSPEKHNVVSKQIHARLRRPLSDCAGTIIYSGRRMVFLEGHWLAPISCRVCYRIVADLGSTAMDCREDCGGVSQKMIFTLTKFGPAKIGAASILFPMRCHLASCGMASQTRSTTQSTAPEASASKRRRKASTNARTEPKIAH